AHRAGRPRPSRASHQGRLRRQEPADQSRRKRPGTAAGDRRQRRSRAAAGGDGMTPQLSSGQGAVHDVDRPPAITSLRSKDLLGISDLTPDEIVLVLDTADAMKEIASRPIKKVPALRGKTVVNLFFEPSTRTRTSFEIAEKRLSADTLNIAIATSSVVTGETLADTARNIEAMNPDMIVVRHASSGACHMLSRICRSAIINAGDGMHEHPTQALLDAFTIREHKKQLKGLKVAIVGDLAHSRVL